jgi:transposase
VRLRLGIDVACKAAHQVSCTDETGKFLFSGRRFRSTVDELEKLWASLPAADEVLVVLDPTRNAGGPLAAWLRARGAKVALVPPEQSADLRDYYQKHTKNDRLDSRMLARLPLLHPEGLRVLGEHELGPADPLRRATRRRRSLVKRRTATYARIDALLELLGPHWADALSGGEYNKTALTLLERTGGDPHAVKRLGRKRLTALLVRASRGQWRDDHADRILHAAEQSLQLWAAGGLDFTELAADLSGEARLALQLSTEIDSLDDRIDVLYDEADPAGLLTSAPGLGVTSAATILAGLGDPDRFTTLAGPLLHRPSPQTRRVRHQQPLRTTHQSRRPRPPRSTVQRRRPGPQDRPDAGRPLPPPGDPSRQTPQLSVVHPGRRASHPPGRLLAQSHRLPTPRHRRPAHHRC